MDWLYWAAVLLACTGGAGVGRISRWALEHARPPAPVPSGWCELGTALLWGAVAACLPAAGWPSWWLPVPLALAALTVPLALADLRHRRLPDALTLTAYPVLGTATACAAIAGPGADMAVRAAGAAVLFGAIHAMVRWWSPAALGAGDVKLAGSLGGVLGASGWAALPLAACVAALCSGVLAGAALLARRTGWRSGVPHGPGLLAATLLVALLTRVS